MRIYVACLASYNAGTLHGTWIDLAGKTADDVQKEISEMLAQSPILRGEEWAIYDFEGFGPLRISEQQDIAELAELAEAYEEHGEPLLCWADNLGDIPEAIETFEDAFQGEYASPEDYAEEWLEGTGGLNGMPEDLRGYFDYEAFARDLRLGGDMTYLDAPGGGIYAFRNQ